MRRLLLTVLCVLSLSDVRAMESDDGAASSSTAPVASDEHVNKSTFDTLVESLITPNVRFVHIPSNVIERDDCAATYYHLKSIGFSPSEGFLNITPIYGVYDDSESSQVYPNNSPFYDVAVFQRYNTETLKLLLTRKNISVKETFNWCSEGSAYHTYESDILCLINFHD